MIKPWLILTKNRFLSWIGWNVAKWRRCLNIEQFCIAQLLVSDWNSTTCICLQLIDYVSYKIIGIICNRVCCVACFLMPHCSIKLNFKYWNVFQSNLISVTFFGCKTLTRTFKMLLKAIAQQIFTSSLRYHYVLVLGTDPECKLSTKFSFEFRPW